MKNLIYVCIVSGLLLFTACSNDQEYVFTQLPSERVQALETKCLNTLKESTDGWKLVYYPMEGDYGGFTFLFRFKDKNRVDMISDFESDVTVDYSYNLNLSESLVLTFDSYSPLHRLANPKYESLLEGGKKGFGLQGDFEFVVKEVSADEISLLGKKTGKELKLKKAGADDWNAVKDLAQMAANFVLGSSGLGMTVNGVMMKGGNVVLDDIFHVCKISYKNSEDKTVTVSSPYIIIADGCQFTKEVEVAGVKFDGLWVDLSAGFANREFISNDAAGAVRFFIIDLTPLHLTGDQVPTFMPNKNIASVDMLRSNNAEYIITEMSAGLAAKMAALKAEQPNFINFSLSMEEKEKDVIYYGRFAVNAYSPKKGKDGYQSYYFQNFELLDGTVNKVAFTNQGYTSHTNLDEYKDYDTNQNVKDIYKAFFASSGFTVIRDTEDIFWFRSNADPTVWMKLEAE